MNNEQSSIYYSLTNKEVGCFPADEEELVNAEKEEEKVFSLFFPHRPVCLNK